MLSANMISQKLIIRSWDKRIFFPEYLNIRNDYILATKRDTVWLNDIVVIW